MKHTIVWRVMVRGLQVLIKHLDWMMEDMCVAIYQLFHGYDE